MLEFTLREVASGVHVAEAPQRFLGLEVGARMTVLETDGGLLVHSPLDIAKASVAHLGKARWVLAPNLFHHLYVKRWAEEGLEAWAAPGLPSKRRDLRFHGTIRERGRPFGEDVEVLPFSCFPLSNEVVVLHRPSRTLIVTDLVFHFVKTAPWLTRAVMWGLGGYPGCCTTVLERLAVRRDLARTELSVVAGWDFDRLIMSHGEIIETGGKAAFLGAWAWLGGDGMRALSAGQ